MTKTEIIEECENMIDSGVGIVEVFEWLEDNTDVDPAEIIHELF